MSTINSKNVQVGTSGTASQNFTLYQPATPDGTVRLGVGNSGATTLDAVTVTSAGNVTVSGAVTGGAVTATSLAVNGNNISAVNSLGFRNRLINSDMRIDQRNAGASVTVNSPTAVYPVDRFFGEGQSADGVFTLQRSSVAPSGFTNSVIATVTTADSSIGASQYYLFSQSVEGFNVADLGWGTSSAQPVTLSFWVRSSVTGTFGGVVANSSQSRSYPYTFSISSANTWEYKTVTITGDTTGTWLTDNGIGMRVRWSIGAGSSIVGTANAWAGSFLAGATGQTNLIATNGATFFITGVQLEAGTVASPFERVEYGAMLRACQRYFFRNVASSYTAFMAGFMDSTTFAFVRSDLPVTMRANPTFTQSGCSIYRAATSLTIGAITNRSGPTSGSLLIAITNGIAGDGCRLEPDAPGNTGYVEFSAEL